MEINRANIYESKSTRSLILTFGLPSILALIIEMLTGVTDTAFAGNLPDIGQQALVTMGLISPILAIFMAFQTLFAMPAGILIAKYLNQREKGKRCLSAGILLSSLTSGSLSLICFLFLDMILTKIGAKDQVFELAKIYMTVQFLGNVVSSVGYTMTGAIRGIGKPKMEMIIITIAVLSNVVLNTIFSFIFNLGIFGLALGTLGSEIIGAGIAFKVLLKEGMFNSISRFNFKELNRLGKEMFKMGFAQTVLQSLSGGTGFFINWQLLSICSPLVVGAWNIAQKTYLLLFMPIVGLCQGIQGMIAYFNEGKHHEKIKEIVSATKLYCGIYGGLTFLVIIVLKEEIPALFGSRPELTVIAGTICLIIFSTFTLVGNFYTNVIVLQVTGREISSVVLVLIRQVFLVLPLVLIMPKIFGNFGLDKLQGLFFSMPVADIMVLLLSYAWMKKQMKT